MSEEAKPIIPEPPAPVLPPEPSKLVIAKGFRVTESSQGPTSLGARFVCQTCMGGAEVVIPWNATDIERSLLMKAAVDEHRLLCPIGSPEDYRVYQIIYPRA